MERVDLWPARGICGVSGDKQRCDREVAVDMLPCCRRGAGVTVAARRDHDGYSDTPGRTVLPDGGTLPRLAHAEKNSWGVDGPPVATGVLSGRGGRKRGSVLRCINEVIHLIQGCHCALLQKLCKMPKSQTLDP